ncbi:MAG: GHKL domain-containing protein [Lentisphaeria bacterium]|nr:ATP-binding protein [Lentisphaeria bacterium]NQZ68718.1 GHKL domain-containing protein [Lentisphaeria bacterium]
MIYDTTETNEQFAVLNYVESGICVTDLSFNILFINRRFENWTKLKLKSVCNHKLTEIFPHLEEDRYLKRLTAIINGGPPLVFSAQIHPHFILAETNSGDEMSFQTTVAKYIPESGEAVLMISLQDMTEPIKSLQNITGLVKALRKVELKLELKIEELAQTNDSLEQFAFTASHDLQEPLRKILTFVSFLKDDYSEGFDDTADEYISYVLDAGHRMQDMIRSLLKLSQINETTLTNIGCGALIESIISDQSIKIKEKDACITYNCIPTLFADEFQIRLIITNLLSNALKFNTNKPNVHIEISKGNEFFFISVEDNGIGIEKKYFDKIFQLFKGLHRRDKFEGTGIGLSYCKRIIDLHQGTVDIQSEINKGTKFTFKIPIQELLVDTQVEFLE